MLYGGRIAALGAAFLVTTCALASCGSSRPDQKDAGRNRTTTTTSTAPPTTSTTLASSTTTHPGTTVPNVIGMKIVAAHTALRAVGLLWVGLNEPCNKGTLASQSVVASLAVAGRGADPRVGATPLNPGSVVPPGSRVGITWSGCYGDVTVVPVVTGSTFVAARLALHAVGLNWACYSVGKTTTTTTKTPMTSSSVSSTTTTTVKVPETVLTQAPGAGTVLHPGAAVAFTMHHCPQ